MGCNCCDQPPCSAPSLECDSISASQSKEAGCGHSDGGKLWKKATTTETGSCSTTDTETGLHSETTEENTWNHSATFLSEYNEACEVVNTSTGSSSSIKKVTTDFFVPAPDDIVIATDTCTSTLTDGVWSGSVHTIVKIDDVVDYENTGAINVPCSSRCGGSISSETVYSNEVIEETTEELISRTVGELPSYPDTWGGSCSTFRNLSDDESSYSLRRFKWRLKHAPTGTCYLKVWLQKRFAPEGGGGEVITPLSPYTWTGSGSPCFTDSAKPASHENNEITGAETEETESSEDGTTTVEVLKWSCLAGYEPPDDGSANGFPPEGEA